MRILCYVNHFFGQNPYFLGKSSLPPGTDLSLVQAKATARKKHVETVVENLKKLPGIEVRVCGISGFSLVPLDLEFNHIKDRPLWLIYETLNHMANAVDQYDYFINIEDDVLLPEETFNNIVEFDKASLINEVFLPNRLEKSKNGTSYCVDLIPLPGWTQQQKKFKGVDLQVAFNPHSALFILSQQKFKYALQFLDRSFRQATLYNELDSAFAYFHSPFCLFRSKALDFHFVIHLDNWSNSPGEANHPGVWRSRLTTISVIDFIPPIFVRLYLFLKKKTQKG